MTIALHPTCAITCTIKKVEKEVERAEEEQCASEPPHKTEMAHLFFVFPTSLVHGNFSNTIAI